MATLAESFLADLEDLSDDDAEEPQQQEAEGEGDEEASWAGGTPLRGRGGRSCSPLRGQGTPWSLPVARRRAPTSALGAASPPPPPPPVRHKAAVLSSLWL